MARTGRPKAELTLTDEERTQLMSWARRHNAPLALRARIVLACAQTSSNKAVAAELMLNEATVGKWRRRFIADRLDGLVDAARQGRPATIGVDQIREVVIATVQTAPPNAAHWSRALMAKRSGLSKSTIGRIWKSFELKPHRPEVTRLAGTGTAVEQLHRVVGLYLDPPENAIAYCVETGTQAGEAGPAGQAGEAGGAGPAAETEISRGIAVRLAELDLADRAPGAGRGRQRALGFTNFLLRLEAEVPAALDVHIVGDTYVMHRAPAIAAWLGRHPRIHRHLGPAGSDWVHQVDGWLTAVTGELRRVGDRAAVEALETGIESWAAEWPENAEPFIWIRFPRSS